MGPNKLITIPYVQTPHHHFQADIDRKYHTPTEQLYHILGKEIYLYRQEA